MDVAEEQTCDGESDEEITITHNRLKGSANMEGQYFEVKLAALLFLLCKIRNIPFRLASNVEDAGAFDDIVLEWKQDGVWHTAFMQLKHKESTIIGKKGLLGPNNAFSLKKYLSSFVKVREGMQAQGCYPFKGTFENAHFIIFTNSTLEYDLKNRDTALPESPVDSLLCTGVDSELILCLNEDKDGDMYQGLKDIAVPDEVCDVTDFLNRLRLFSGEPHEKGFDVLLTNALQEYCKKFRVEYSHSMRKVFVEDIKSWWEEKGRGGILNQNSLELDLRRVEQVMSECKKSLCRHLKFSDVSTSILKQALSGGDTLIHVVADVSVKLTGGKMMQGLDEGSFVLTDSESLTRESSALINVWRYGGKHVLVIVKTEGSLEEFKDQVHTVLKKKPEKRFVLVSSSEDTFVEHLANRLGKRVKHFPDTFLLSHLEVESRNALLDKKVILQGHVTSLRAMLGDNIDALPEEIKVCVDFFIDRKHLEIGTKMKDGIEYYVDRNILSQGVVKNTIFTDKFYSGKIVIDSTIEEVLKVIPSPETYHKIETTENGLVFFPRIEGGEETVNDVHYFDLIDKRFVWRRTVGDIRFVTKHLDNSVKPVLNDRNERVTLVVAEPGMGKSTLLSRLAQNMKKTYPYLWVGNVILSEHTTWLNETKDEDINAESFLCSALGFDNDCSVLDKCFLKYALRKSGKMMISLDGFDEIAPRYKDKCLKLISSIVKTKVERVWVASRHSMQDALETNLSTVAVTLQKFTEKDQEEFLVKYWGPLTKYPAEDLSAFSKRVLNKVGKSMNDREKDFTGVPLQTHMIAEVFLDLVTGKRLVFPDNLDVLQLMEQFVEKKFRVSVIRTYGITEDTPNFDEFFIKEKNILTGNHEQAALHVLVEIKEFAHLKCLNQKVAHDFFSNVENGCERTGFVHRIANGKPVFVHRAFAEYFVAHLLTKHFADMPLLQNTFFGDTFGVVRSIFDRILARDLELHNAVLSADKMQVTSLLLNSVDLDEVDVGGRTAIHVAIAADMNTPSHDLSYIPIIETLLKKGVRIDVRDKVMQWTPVEYAKHGTLRHKAVDCDSKIILDLLFKVEDDQDVRTSKQMVSKFDSQFSESNMPKVNKTTLDLEDPNTLLKASEQGLLNVVRLVLDFYRDNETVNCTNIRDRYGQSPLLQAVKYGHSDVVRLLVKAGADVDLRDGQGRTMLSIAVQNHQNDIAQILLNTFTDPKRRSIYVNVCDVDGLSALWRANETGNHDMMRFLMVSGADVNLRNKNGRSLLIDATSRSDVKSVQIILSSFTNALQRQEYLNSGDGEGLNAMWLACRAMDYGMMRFLVEAGADVTVRDRNGVSMLSFAASMSDLKSIQIILSSIKNDSERRQFLNIGDGEGLSALWRAFEIKNQDIMRCLVEAGADVTLLDKNGSSMIMEASKNGTLSPIQILLSSRFTDDDERRRFVNVRDVKGRSALWYACEHGHTGVVEYLVETGADVTLRDQNGTAMIFTIAHRGQVEVVRALLTAFENDDERREHLNGGDKWGRTALWYAKDGGNKELIKMLMEI